MSTVILAEKPSVAREIAGVLGAGVKRDGYFQTKDGKRVVTWAFGHLVRYAEPHEYGEAWSGRWNLEDLPMVPGTWLFKVQDESAAQFARSSKLMKQAERVVCATDAGREGEHIFRLIYGTRLHGAGRKLWVSSLTQEALKNGFRNLKPGSDFDLLGEAAQARAKADWLVGFTSRGAYSARHGTKCSVGRVQTPTLALVVARDREIDGFKPSSYYEVWAHLTPGFDAVYARQGDPDDKGPGDLGAAHRWPRGSRRHRGGGRRGRHGGGGRREQPHRAAPATFPVRPDGAAARGQQAVRRYGGADPGGSAVAVRDQGDHLSAHGVPAPSGRHAAATAGPPGNGGAPARRPCS